MTRADAEVVVVGAGPAGSILAGVLARRGRDVLLVDRASFPRPKPCGECLNPGALEALGELGLLESVRAGRPARLRGWSVRSAAGEEAHGTYGGAHLHGLGIERRELDRTLARWAREGGARLREGTRVTDVDPGGKRRPARIRFRTGSGPGGEWRAPVAVGADGLRSVVARSAGLVLRRPRLRKLSLTCHVEGKGPEPGRGYLHLGRGVLLGLAPLTPSGDRWNASVVVDARRHGRAVAADAAAFHRRILEAFPVPWSGAPRTTGGPWASGPFDWPCRRAQCGRVVLVGDAAGYYDPLTGQGIRRAILSAVRAAEAIDLALSEPEGGQEDHLSSYDRSWRRRIAPGRRVQRAVELVVSRPRLLRAFLKGAGAAPEGLTPLLRVTGDVAPSRSLLHPGRWIPFLHPALPKRGRTIR